MNKLLVFCVILVKCSIAQIWSPVGPADIMGCYTSEIFYAISPIGEPYVIVRGALGATVKKFDGNNWILVGSNYISAGNVGSTNITFDNSGNPQVAYTDWHNGGKATAMKFDGSNWAPIGSPNFTQRVATYISMANDPTGVPYVAFRDFSMGYRATVMKFDGTAWIYVGSPGFSQPGTGGASYLSLAFDSNGTPYVAYSDHSNLPVYKASVMKFDGTNWVYVGGTGFSASDASNTSLVIDSNDAPIVAYSDGANGGKATVMKFNGVNWEPIGLPGFTPDAAGYTSLAIDNNDVFYVAYKDYANSQKASVMTFNGSTWVNLGSPAFSISDVVKSNKIAVDKNSGAIYTAYVNVYAANTNTPTYGASVMKYNLATSVKETQDNYSFDIYPNPTNRIITIKVNIKANSEDFVLTVNNTLGKTVYSEDLKSTSETFTKHIDLTSLPKGIYFIDISSSSPSSKVATKQITKKVILQ